jgi:transcriptional regulator with AAA-type ATPase domain
MKTKGASEPRSENDHVVLVQWVGPGSRSAPDRREPVPFTLAKTLSPKAAALVFVHENRERSNKAFERIFEQCKSESAMSSATVVEIVLGPLADIDDPRCCRDGLNRVATVRRWAPRSRDQHEASSDDPLSLAISWIHGTRRPVRWALSAATGTSSIIATLLSELADALADAIARRTIESARLDCLRWDQVEARTGERQLQPIESIDAQKDLVGRSRRVRTRVLAKSPIGVPVLLTGPTGVGKTTIAEHLHELWWQGMPSELFRVNCSLLEPELAAAELFGAKKGSYTGATHDREGVFGAAAKQRSTIFLDEFAELPRGTQAKLLTAIEPSGRSGTRVHRFQPVGSAKESEIAVEKLRIVLATHRKIEGEGSVLREDLVARVSQVVVRIAPLRETPAAIPLSVLEAIESLNTPQSALTIADIGALPALLDATTDAHRSWRFNHRDVRRLAIEMAMAARAEDTLSAMRNRKAIERAHVRVALERTRERAASEGVPSSASDPWHLELGTLPSKAIEHAMAEMPLTKRYQALLLVRAWQESSGNAAAAWRLLVEHNAFEPGRGANVARNASSAFTQRWRAIFGDEVQTPSGD